MKNCGIDLNFLESNNELIIKSLVDISDSIPLSSSYQWYKGLPGKSYGGFVKEIGSDDRKGLKAFILPKATKLAFTEIEKTSVNANMLNSENKNRIPGNLTLVGENRTLYFYETTGSDDNELLSVLDLCEDKISEPQDLGEISYKDMTSESTEQMTQSVDTTASVLTENFISEERLLPDTTPEKQYEFATSFLKVGDYNTAERAFREFVISNSNHKLAGNAQYWYAETFRIRQLYTDAASAYLEGYQNYPDSETAPINLLKLGVSLVQIGEKDQGCSMILGVKDQYPDAKDSVIQRAKYEEKKFECKKNKS